jgi:Uma2 family endonuclease
MARFVHMTSEELALHPVPHKRTELVRGRLVVREPAKRRHGAVAARVVAVIDAYLETNPIGEVYGAETGFTLFRHPDTVRAPDAAYLRLDRIPTEECAGFDEVAPDLVVEVLSPGDRTRMVRAKVSDWLRAGTRLVWLIDPQRRVGAVHRADGSATALTEDDAFHGEDVLPEFSVSLQRLLTRPGGRRDSPAE